MIYDKPYETTYESTFDFVKHSIYLSNLKVVQKQNLLIKIITELSIEDAINVKKELLGHYSNRCNKFLSDNSIFVDFDYITKYMNENNMLFEEYLSMKMKEINGASGGYHREMNVKDIKELCKANQIKLSRVVDGKRVAYKKKELMTKLKRKKLL